MFASLHCLAVALGWSPLVWLEVDSDPVGICSHDWW